MGIQGVRQGVLLKLKDILNGLTIVDLNNNGNGTRLHVENKIFDIESLNYDMFPLLSIIPAPHTIQTGLYGHSMDSTYRVAMFGYVRKAQNEDLFISSENVIECIIQKLTNFELIEEEFIVRNFNNVDTCFSIVEIGPILNELYTDERNTAGALAYISIPLAIQFVEN
jgi:hypothetical protein